MKSKIKVQIKSIWGTLLYESEKETVCEAVVEANLRNADLRNADLRGANLYDTDMRGADLRGANLYDTDMRGADLRGANLYDTDLRNADLRGANLYDTDLRNADLRGANLYDTDLYDTDLRNADLRGANLYDTDLEKLPTAYINECSRDILFILEHLKSEVPGLKKALLEGRVDGSQYEGKCACLIGTLGNVEGDVEKVCEAIPFYEKGTHNPGESFFLNIREGDTPETNSFSKHAVMLCDMVIGEL
jgi:uncharacterized protein YjbI with pentapeptide repeats